MDNIIVNDTIMHLHEFRCQLTRGPCMRVFVCLCLACEAVIDWNQKLEKLLDSHQSRPQLHTRKEKTNRCRPILSEEEEWKDDRNTAAFSSADKKLKKEATYMTSLESRSGNTVVRGPRNNAYYERKPHTHTHTHTHTTCTQHHCPKRRNTGKKTWNKKRITIKNNKYVTKIDDIEIISIQYRK